MAPKNPEMVKASFAFWLLLCTNPDFTGLDVSTDQPVVVPSVWKPDNLPANMAALITSPADMERILEFLATPYLSDGRPYWHHFQAVQDAYQKIMNEEQNGTTAVGIPAIYPTGDPTCPRYHTLETLQLSFAD